MSRTIKFPLVGVEPSDQKEDGYFGALEFACRQIVLSPIPKQRAERSDFLKIHDLVRKNLAYFDEATQSYVATPELMGRQREVEANRMSIDAYAAKHGLIAPTKVKSTKAPAHTKGVKMSVETLRGFLADDEIDNAINYLEASNTPYVLGATGNSQKEPNIYIKPEAVDLTKYGLPDTVVAQRVTDNAWVVIVPSYGLSVGGGFLTKDEAIENATANLVKVGTARVKTTLDNSTPYPQNELREACLFYTTTP